MTEPGQKILIVGLGNPLSGDDRFGSYVLEKLPDTPKALRIDAHTDLLNHIQDFSEYSHVILIDAILDPDNKLGQPGQIVVLNEETFQAWPETSEGVHQMSPLLAVKLFRRLYPESGTKITLVGLLVDALTHTPRYAAESIIEKAAEIISRIS